MTIDNAAELAAELERLLPDWIDLEPGSELRVLPGLRLPVEWLGRNTLPSLLEALREMGVI